MMIRNENGDEVFVPIAVQAEGREAVEAYVEEAFGGVAPEANENEDAPTASYEGDAE